MKIRYLTDMIKRHLNLKQKEILVHFYMYINIYVKF